MTKSDNGDNEDEVFDREDCRVVRVDFVFSLFVAAEEFYSLPFFFSFPSFCSISVVGTHSNVNIIMLKETTRE